MGSSSHHLISVEKNGENKRRIGKKISQNGGNYPFLLSAVAVFSFLFTVKKLSSHFFLTFGSFKFGSCCK